MPCHTPHSTPNNPYPELVSCLSVETPKGQQPPRTPPVGQPPQLTSTDGQLVDAPPPPTQGEGSGTGEGAGGQGQRKGSQTIPPSPGPAKRDPSKIPPAQGEEKPKKRGPRKTPEERAKVSYSAIIVEHSTMEPGIATTCLIRSPRYNGQIFDRCLLAGKRFH